jgi:hypothetical protein
MKTFLASLGGALAMLLVVATWQARTSAVPVAPLGAAQWPQQTMPVPYAPSYPAAYVPQPAASYASSPGAEMPAQPAGLVPVSYLPSGYRPATSNLVQLESPQVVPVRSVVHTTRRVQYREGTRRNWAKTALVIGGSAGAAAGIGALAGGKKGALVGAAIGGGAASLFEALKK